MTEVAWAPLPRQELALRCPYKEIFFGGSRGGGKSHWLIGEALANIHRYGEDGKVLVLRRQLGHFQELKSRFRKICSRIPGAKWSEQERMWSFANGGFIRLNYLDRDEDVEQYQGHEYSAILFDELCHWPTPYAYDWLWSCQRSPNPEVKIRRCATGNPGGPGMAWVKARFIDPAPPETPITEKIILPDDLGEEESTRIFIPSSVRDNKYIGKSYMADLMRLPDNLRRMYLDGDWNVTEGAFFSNWDSKVHIVDPMDIPNDWQKWMGFDWGTWHPYAAVWMAQAPWGDIYVYREMYGQSQDDAGKNAGTNETPMEVAKKIMNVEQLNGDHISERWADGSIFDGQRPWTIGDQFADAGILFRPSPKMNKAAALQSCKELMNVTNGKSRLKVFSSCRNFIRTVPALQFDTTRDGVYQKDGENHLADAWSYAMRRGMHFLKDGTMMDPGQKVQNFNNKRLSRYREIAADFY